MPNLPILDKSKLFYDLPAKLLSLALAFALFFFNKMESIVPKTLLVPLSISLPAGLTPAEPYPRRVRALVRGPKEAVEQVSDGDYEALGDLTEDRGEGIYLIPLRLVRSDQRAPLQNVEVSLEVNELRLPLERSVTKVVEVSVPVIGNPENGFQLESILVSPPAVSVRGPRTRMESLTRLFTENLEVSSRTESFSARLQLTTSDPLLELVSGTLVEVRVGITPIVEEKWIEDLPVVFQGLSPNLRIVSETVLASLHIQGPQTLVNLTGPQTLTPTVSLENIVTPGAYELPIRWNLDPRIQVIDQRPRTAVIRLEYR